jgi:DNA-directed RNA polymerase specialized sigma24 family protein
VTIDYTYPINDTAVKKMVDALHYIIADPEERKELNDEVAWESHEYHTTGKVVRLQDELAEKDRELAEKDRELAETKQQAEDAKRREEDAKRKIVINLHKKGLNSAEIAETAEISETEVNNILNS